MRRHKNPPSFSSVMLRMVIFLAVMVAAFAWASDDPRSQQLWQAWEAHAGNVIGH